MQGRTTVAIFCEDAKLLIDGEYFVGAKPLADAYEKLKELRREAPVGQSSERFAELIKKIDAAPEIANKAVPLVRAVLAMRTRRRRGCSDQTVPCRDRLRLSCCRTNSARPSCVSCLNGLITEFLPEPAKWSSGGFQTMPTFLASAA
jgi:hypothetical protein